MAKGEGRLVPVDELPRRARHGKYARVLDEFLRGRAPHARYETDAKTSNVAAALRAAVRSSGAAVTVRVVNGEVYLSRE